MVEGGVRMLMGSEELFDEEFCWNIWEEWDEFENFIFFKRDKEREECLMKKKECMSVRKVRVFK